MGASRSLDQTALRPSVIKRIRQMTHMQSVFAKKNNGNVHKKKDKKNMLSLGSKNDTVVFRII